MALLVLIWELAESRSKDPQDWDWLALASYFWFSIALFLGSSITGIHKSALETLEQQGTLLCQINVEACVTNSRQCANRFGLTGFALLPAVFAIGLAVQGASSSYVGAWILIGCAAGYPTGRTIGFLWGNVRWERENLRSEKIRIVPGHLDGAGGLRPIGTLLLTRSWVAFVAILHVGVSFMAMQFWQLANYHHWIGIYLTLLLVIVSLILPPCVQPAFKANAMLVAKKKKLASVLNKKIRRSSKLIVELLNEGSPSDGGGTADDHDSLIAQCKQLQELPEWPLDSKTLQRVRALITLVTTPIFVGFLEVLGVFEAIKSAFGR